jgi:hypothetical protein
MRHEIIIKIIDERYTDSLIVALARQGHGPYLSEQGDVCFTTDSDEVWEIKRRGDD